MSRPKHSGTATWWAESSTKLKILGNGELTKKLKISAHRFSKTASEKIAAAGGEAIVLPGPAPVVKAKAVRQEKEVVVRR